MYKDLTMREAYDYFKMGLPVERYYVDSQGFHTDVGLLRERYSTEGKPGTWEEFRDTYSGYPPLFRLEVE